MSSTSNSSNDTQKFVVELTKKGADLHVGPGGYRDSKGRLKEQFKNPRPLKEGPQLPSQKNNALPQNSKKNPNHFGKTIINYFGQILFQEFLDPALRDGVSMLREKTMDTVIQYLEPTTKNSSSKKTYTEIIDVDCNDISTDQKHNRSAEGSNDVNGNLIDFKSRVI